MVKTVIFGKQSLRSTTIPISFDKHSLKSKKNQSYASSEDFFPSSISMQNKRSELNYAGYTNSYLKFSLIILLSLIPLLITSILVLVSLTSTLTNISNIFEQVTLVSYKDYDLKKLFSSELELFASNGTSTMKNRDIKLEIFDIFTRRTPETFFSTFQSNPGYYKILAERDISKIVKTQILINGFVFWSFAQGSYISVLKNIIRRYEHIYFLFLNSSVSIDEILASPEFGEIEFLTLLNEELS